MKRLTKLLHKGEKGFTLIELLVVIAILGVLAAVVVPDFGSFFDRGQTEACALEERMVTTITVAYAADNEACPTEIADLSAFFEDTESIQGAYTFSGTYPDCTVEQDECPASGSSGGGGSVPELPGKKAKPWQPLGPGSSH